VTQEGSLLPDLSIAENIFLGRRHVARRGRIDWGATRRAARQVLGRLDVDLDPARPVRTLPSDARQLVEIGRAISTDARVLLLDEPTSSLDLREWRASSPSCGGCAARG
jgi:ABC-type sugar transport system ATPase subunit